VALGLQLGHRVKKFSMIRCGSPPPVPSSQMGVGVAVGRLPVGRPPGTADPAQSRQGRSLPRACSSASSFRPCGQPGALPRPAPPPRPSRRTPVLEPPQPLEQDRKRLLVPGVPDDPTREGSLGRAVWFPTPMSVSRGVQGTVRPLPGRRVAVDPHPLPWPGCRRPGSRSGTPGAPLERDREGGLAVGADGVAPDHADPRSGRVDAVRTLDSMLLSITRCRGRRSRARRPSRCVEQAVGRADLGRAPGDEPRPAG
jgi:hypothetical protein